MDKAKIYQTLAQIAVTAVGVMVGVTVLDLAKRKLIKSDFSKPMNVTPEK